MELAASADGSTIYVGGDFTRSAIRPQSHRRARRADRRVAPVQPGRERPASPRIAVNGNTVYFGGDFTTAGGTYRDRLPSRGRGSPPPTPPRGALLPWNPTADNQVLSMVYHPGTGRVIVGGKFNTLNGDAAVGHGLARRRHGRGAPVGREHRHPEPRRRLGDQRADHRRRAGVRHRLGVTSAVARTANFEGVFSADPATGVLDWVDGGRGDNYDITVAGDVLYTVGHPHDWGMLDWNPQTTRDQFQHAMAIDKHRSPTLTNAFGTPEIWVFDGSPGGAAAALAADADHGTYTGQGQAAWSVDSQRRLHRARR